MLVRRLGLRFVGGALASLALIVFVNACGHDPYTAGPVCHPGDTLPCYSGPAGTEGVGLCAAGVRQCNEDLEGYGACLYEVTPVPETCATPEDDDCDGESNEEGDGCECAPEDVEPCYSGPVGTADVGLCKSGTRACDNGMWAECTGEVLPGAEDPTNLIDEDCDGIASS